MITVTLVILAATLAVFAVVVFVVHLVHAPEGKEDETGFHYVKNPARVESRYYCAKPRVIAPGKATKPLKTRLPAA